MSFLADIGAAFGSIGGAVDGMFTSDEERLKFRNQLAEIEMKVAGQVIQLEKAKMELQVKMMESSNKLATVEAQSDHNFTRLYRPSIIVAMFLLILANYFGWLAKDLPDIFVTIFGSCFGIVPLGRTAEKIAEKVIRKRER